VPNSAKSPQGRGKPLLLLDIDGVISLFGFDLDECPPGTWHAVEGIAHFLSSAAAGHLQVLDEWFETWWCSGWEEKADEHLPALLGLRSYPHLSFGRNGAGAMQGAAAGSTPGHWKLAAIDAQAADRPLAWVDDTIDAACEAWAAARPAPTLLVLTDPAVGLVDEHVERLVGWAKRLG
jgi:hypothetical protein